VSTVRVEVEAGVATVTLDDPTRRNALSAAMVGELTAAFDTLEGDADVGAVVVTGAPPAFCAGADLSHLGQSPDAKGLGSVYEGFLRVGRCALPTVAAVNGAAVGAGVNLALACDLRLAARSARFDTRFLQLGLHPGGGHTWMLTRIAGPQTAAATVLFGEVLDGEAAERCGLAWRCVDDDDLLHHARALAGRAASAPRALARRVKQTLAAVADVSTSGEAVALELEAQLWSMAQPDFAERLAALRARTQSR
jgi:enoyl-CoA hydratase